ncbi:MAG: YggS family pyridoxal phosphate-dependent enzyme [Paracoccaceae bacterium]
MSLQEIQGRVDIVAQKAGHNVELIAVSKVQPNARVLAVLAKGQRVFGENRVQEAAGKWPGFHAQYPDTKLHLIGPLQTNKLNQALDLFDAIHTLDREKLARKLAAAVQARGACPQLFIQVNTGAEPQKAGVLPVDTDVFIKTCRDIYDLNISGLMVIPPVQDDPARHFIMLAKIATQNGLNGLSMGMSSDFEVAIAHGATHVRVGSAIFGARGL